MTGSPGRCCLTTPALTWGDPDNRVSPPKSPLASPTGGQGSMASLSLPCGYTHPPTCPQCPVEHAGHPTVPSCHACSVHLRPFNVVCIRQGQMCCCPWLCHPGPSLAQCFQLRLALENFPWDHFPVIPSWGVAGPKADQAEPRDLWGRQHLVEAFDSAPEECVLRPKMVLQ